MALIVQLIIFAFGITFVLKGGDIFVTSATNISKKFKVPSFIIGATIVSFATTLPEILVSLTAAIEGKTEMAVGNAVGSVIANTALILAISYIAVQKQNLKKYDRLKLLLLSALIIVLIFSETNNFSVVAALLLLLIFVLFVIFNLQDAKNEDNDEPEEEIAMFKKAKKDIIAFILGTFLVFVGSRLMVNSGTVIAQHLNVSERIISLTLLAIGTSLPELVTTITALIKKNASLSIGNIIGANIINLTLILPLCTVINGHSLPIDNQSIILDIPFCLIVCLIGIIPNVKKIKTVKLQGVVLLLMYLIYLIAINI